MMPFLSRLATSNTVSKIAYGIADSLVTNAVAQAVKGGVPVYIVPVDIEAQSCPKCPIISTENSVSICEDCPHKRKLPSWSNI